MARPRIKTDNLIVPGEMDAWLSNNSSSKVYCELVPGDGSMVLAKDADAVLRAGERKVGRANRATWRGGYGPNDGFKFACRASTEDGKCTARMLGKVITQNTMRRFQFFEAKMKAAPGCRRVCLLPGEMADVLCDTYSVKTG